MAEDHRAPRTEEVEIAVAVGVEQISALGMGDERRMAAYCAKGPNGRINASGEILFGAELKLMGAGSGAGHQLIIGTAAASDLRSESRRH
jgi:hypothetical protein